MPDNLTDLSEVLSLTRTYNASTERVYSAWTNVDHLSKWWGPPGSVVKEVELDLQVGGRYKIGFQQPDGQLLYVSGVYEEIHPSKKLVFTWHWENPEMDIGYSLVTLEFIGDEQNTELILTHERLPTLEARNNHREGWVGILGELTAFIEGQQ